jgi:hypothetical protein
VLDTDAHPTAFDKVIDNICIAGVVLMSSFATTLRLTVSLANGVFARHSSRTLHIHVKQAVSALLKPLPENDSLSITSLACCNTEWTRNTQPL